MSKSDAVPVSQCVGGGRGAVAKIFSAILD